MSEVDFTGFAFHCASISMSGFSSISVLNGLFHGCTFHLCQLLANLAAMDPQAQRDFLRDHLDSDLQFILGESGITLANQVAIARHY